LSNIVLESVLAKVRESDLQVFKNKILPMEEDKATEIKAKGLLNLTQLMEEQKSGYALDYSKMGSETNVDGEALMVPSNVAVVDKVDTRSGNEMFKEFLEKLR
jgi:hypothetical protein